MNFDVKTKINMKADIEVLDKMAMALEDLMYGMEADAVRLCAVDTGRLKGSIHLDKIDKFKILLLAGVDYAAHVEYGTRPHKVSGKHLKGWARRVLNNEGAAYAIAGKIAKEGTDAQPFFRPSLDMAKERVPETIDAYMK